MASRLSNLSGPGPPIKGTSVGTSSGFTSLTSHALITNALSLKISSSRDATFNSFNACSKSIELSFLQHKSRFLQIVSIQLIWVRLYRMPHRVKKYQDTPDAPNTSAKASPAFSYK